MRKLYTYFVLILGVAMIGLGIYLMFNPSTSLQALTIFIGIILVLNGINEVISYFGEHKYWSISKWIMLDGILSILIGGFAIFESNMAERVFIIIFAIWILASAILRILTAFAVKRFSRMDITTYHGNYRIDYCYYFLVHEHASSNCDWDYTWNIFHFPRYYMSFSLVGYSKR